MDLLVDSYSVNEIFVIPGERSFEFSATFIYLSNQAFLVKLFTTLA